MRATSRRLKTGMISREKKSNEADENLARSITRHPPLDSFSIVSTAA
jgi:hypothetical protein